MELVTNDQQSGGICKTLFLYVYKSFIFSKNRMGPRTDPCGKPYAIEEKEELQPFIETYCLWSVRYDLSQLLDNSRTQ